MRKIIIVEGPDGTGKSTIANRLASIYKAPHLSFPSPFIRQILKKWASASFVEKSAILEQIKKDFALRLSPLSLPDKRVIIIERSPISTVVYQQDKFFPAQMLRTEFYRYIFELLDDFDISIIFTMHPFRLNDDLWDQNFLKSVRDRYKIEYVYWLFRSRKIRVRALWNPNDYKRIIERAKKEAEIKLGF